MAKPPCAMETVNDLHGDLINLARVIQDPQLGPKLYRKLRRTLMHEQLFKEAAERIRAVDWSYLSSVLTPHVKRACDYMLCAWLGRNGVAGTLSYNQGFCVRYTNRGGDANRRWRSAIESIPAWRRRLAKVTILQRDAFELLERIDDAPGTAIYIDPPYLKKGSKYIHDFEGADHQRLAELLARFNSARVVVSYYDHPKLAELYPSWQRIEIPVTRSLVSQGKRDKDNKVKVIEVLLVNQKRDKRNLFE